MFGDETTTQMTGEVCLGGRRRGETIKKHEEKKSKKSHLNPPSHSHSHCPPQRHPLLELVYILDRWGICGFYALGCTNRHGTKGIVVL